MLYLVKLFPEITIKSRPVRKRQTRQLRKNLRSVLVPLDNNIQVTGEWDSIEVATGTDRPELLEQIRERLVCTPGISLILEVDKRPLPDLAGILALAREYYGERVRGKTFAVRCKRIGKHDFRSVDVERFVGAGLMQENAPAGVNLSHPEVTVALEIRHDTLYVVRAQHRGLGGYPLGCQDAVLSLISGGFDSSVSSYHCIRRGLQTHYCFFNLGGRAHELAVKEVALYLWQRYHSSHRVMFISVPFEGVLTGILEQVDNAQMGVILKRMMLRAAARIAERLEVKALVTGESVAQVSSQTLTNLSVIDAATDTLVLRPLITMDKQEIIDTARIIGTEELSRTIPEYCAAISRNPTTRAKLARTEHEEGRFDFSVLEQALSEARFELITDVLREFTATPDEVEEDVEIVPTVEAGATVIDIRHPVERETRPLTLVLPENGELKTIPFYQLHSSVAGLDRQQRLLLYCDRGMMSRLHAANLQDEGFTNVAVLEPLPQAKQAS